MSQRFKMHLKCAKDNFLLFSFCLKLYKPIADVVPLSLLFECEREPGG